MGTVFLFLLLTLSLFLKDTQKMKKNIVSDAFRSHGKVFCTVNNEEMYKAVDLWLMDRQPFGVTKFEGSLGWHHKFATWHQVRPALLWNVRGQGCCIFFMF